MARSIRSLLAAITLGILAAPAIAEPALSWEQLRANVTADGRVTDDQLRQRTGWQVVHGFRWGVEKEDPQLPGKFVLAERAHVFRHGQLARFRIETLCDLRVVLLARNADDTEALLVPERDEPAPVVKAGKWLPTHRTQIKFLPPAGEERFVLIAAPEELAWIARSALLKKADDLTAQDKDLLKRLDESLRDAVKTQQGLLQPGDLGQAAAAIQAGRLKRGARVVAVGSDGRGRRRVLFAAGGPQAGPALIDEITLRHEN